MISAGTAPNLRHEILQDRACPRIHAKIAVTTIKKSLVFQGPNSSSCTPHRSLLTPRCCLWCFTADRSPQSFDSLYMVTLLNALLPTQLPRSFIRFLREGIEARRTMGEWRKEKQSIKHRTKVNQNLLNLGHKVVEVKTKR